MSQAQLAGLILAIVGVAAIIIAARIDTRDRHSHQ